VLSGETGAGKTMLLQAISLLLGQKAQVKLIRKGEEKAFIQASFILATHSPVHRLLQENGLDVDEEVTIHREITTSGKNRIFIENQPAPLPLLKSIAPYLIETISQHSQLSLKEVEIQLDLLDDYAGAHLERQTYQHSFLREIETGKLLREFLSEHEKKQALYPTWKQEYEELDLAKLKKGEEEELFQKYKKMAHRQDLLEEGSLLLKTMTEEPAALLQGLTGIHKRLDKLAKLDAQLVPLGDLVASASEAMTEVEMELMRYMESLEDTPEDFHKIDQRLSQIKFLQRKYKGSIEELCSYKERLLENIQGFESFDEEVLRKRLHYEEAKRQREKNEKILTDKRQEAAKKLGAALTESLQALNMEGAELRILIKETPAKLSGSDEVVFELAANGGDDFYDIREHASGGELSRILFALKLILAEKERGKTLIFDEIDANIGGMTAAILGKKLQKLGQSRQIICITHFPQVAAYADHHLQIMKTSLEGRSMTEVRVLSSEDKTQELMRMLGGRMELFSEPPSKGST